MATSSSPQLDMWAANVSCLNEVSGPGGYVKGMFLCVCTCRQLSVSRKRKMLRN